MTLRRAFTVLEVTVIMAILAIAAGLAIPAYRRHQIRNDLAITAEQIVQAIGRAQLLSQTGEEEDSWGFHVATGTLYRGTAYSARDTDYDETYTFPSTVATSGLSEVFFSRIFGLPSATGSIILTTFTGEQRKIDITINTQGIATDVTDEVTICHKPDTAACQTKRIPDNAWFGPGGHRGHGDMLGPCESCPT